MTRGESLLNFFKKRSSTGWRGGGRERSSGGITKEEFCHLLKMASAHKEVYEDILKFVKGHSKIAKEINMNDVDLLYITETHHSI